MSADQYVAHISTHPNKPGVCLICVYEQGGDPNYISPDLRTHLEKRHNFEVDRFHGGLTEDEALALAIEASKVD
jgi:hypothetical protein